MMLPLVLLLLARPALARLENADVLLSDANPWHYVAKFGYATGDSAWVRSLLRRLAIVCALQRDNVLLEHGAGLARPD